MEVLLSEPDSSQRHEESNKEPGKYLLTKFDECIRGEIKTQNDNERDCAQFLMNYHTFCKEPIKYDIINYIYEMAMLSMKFNFSSLTPVQPSSPCGK